jgi:hypothetical protein
MALGCRDQVPLQPLDLGLSLLHLGQHVAHGRIPPAFVLRQLGALV